ncbi:membrane-associated protein, putative [Bodo saltans]|uniref:Membrane-associated protein, putative n=1 Tax=Bodo saltans TaxID=75058 RepID=A0A0S4JNP9_BODSA|nr:membrane-associated protein, putative [Bodo saltans]|eukprot:CUG91879.1 membrane-associated protein, putative [Bodo saltans]
MRCQTVVLLCLGIAFFALLLPSLSNSPVAMKAKLSATNHDNAQHSRISNTELHAQNDDLNHPKGDTVVAQQDEAGRTDGPLLCNTTWHSFPADPIHPEYKHDQHGCRHRQSITCTGKRLKRALVIYMLQTKNVRNMAVELHNFDFFMNVGVFGEHESTEMFDGVDYVFTRMMPRYLGKVSVPTIIAEDGNIKLMWVPSGPCDLCAHGRVIAHLGGVEAVKANYSFIALLNGGSRGPFQAAGDAEWIDVMAVGGQATWSSATPPIMVGPTVSTQHSVHVQTYCIGLHTARLAEYYPFLTQCNNSAEGKEMCIHGGEVPAGIEWLRGGGWIHSLSTNETFRTVDDAEALVATIERIGFVEPGHAHYDLCSALFAKFGGTFTNSVRLRTAAHAAQLILFRPLKRTLSGRFLLQKLLRSGRFLSLADGVNFTILINAWYGVPEVIEISKGVMERLRQNVEENRVRLVVPSNLTEFFGFDPAPNASKVLAIHVRYNDNDHHLRAIDGEVFEFPSDTPKNHTVILNAWYGVPTVIEISKGVMERLRQNVEENRGRLVVPSNLTEFFGFDPAPNASKVLAIHVRYNKNEHHLRAIDGEALQFPDG